MTYDKIELEAKANEYCHYNRKSITQSLGFGTQGVVFKITHGKAIKVHHLESGYIRERDAYLRLRERGIREIQGMQIPRFEGYDNSRLILEMSVVHIPCILDFGGAYLDHPPPHLQRDDEWFESKQDEFGENWKKAYSVIAELEARSDMWLVDVNPGNIKFQSTELITPS